MRLYLLQNEIVFRDLKWRNKITKFTLCRIYFDIMFDNISVCSADERNFNSFTHDATYNLENYVYTIIKEDRKCTSSRVIDFSWRIIGLIIRLQFLARLDANVRCRSSMSHDRNSQSANPRRNLGAGAIRPVTEKAVRYFILTSRWTESARRVASRYVEQRCHPVELLLEGQWRLSPVYRFYVRSPLTRDWIRDHYARSLPR